MSELRWIILGLGLVFIAAVYFFSRRQDINARRKVAKRIGEEPYIGHPESEAAPEPAPEQEEKPAPEQPKKKASEELILAVHVAARSDNGFGAIELAAVMTAAGMQVGHYDIYHHVESETNWFSAANMVEPGRFPEPRSGERSPGITLFMMMPGLDKPQQTLEAMLATARRLAADLDGTLLDTRHKLLTAQGAQRMREQLAEFRAQQSRFIHPFR